MSTLLPPDDPRHGCNGYSNLGCRCDVCREAQSIATSEQRRRRFAHGLSPSDPRHGTHVGYNQWGCRCRPCTEAASRVTVASRRHGRS